MSAVAIRDVHVSYKGVPAVRGVTLDIEPGAIFGLVGPDGAGKTSLFHVIAGVMLPDRGEVSIDGQPAREARATTGYLTQTFSLPTDLTVTENVRHAAALRRISASDSAARGHEYLRQFGMSRFLDRATGKLSGGMKQKVALACALVAAPRLVLLDEPTTGVDPVSRRQFWDALTLLAAEGITIVIATPYLDEAERCTSIAILHEGAVLDHGTPAELRRRSGLQRLEVRTSDLRHAAELLSRDSRLGDVLRFGDRLDVLVADAAAGEQIVAASGIGDTVVRRAAPTLENVFVRAVRARGGEAAPSSPSMPEWSSPRPSGDAIVARALTKSFGAFEAVRGVDLTVRYGEIYGLLGGNGAGKTTTIKMLCGLLAPTRGTSALGGRPATDRATRQQLGYASQKFSLYDELSVEENLDFFAGVYGVPLQSRGETIRWVADHAGLGDRLSVQVGSLPGGWKQRLALGAATMHAPSILFLDEPTSGVDPLARRRMWQLIQLLADRGVAILVTTHSLDEAEQCHRLGVMVAGEIVASGTPAELKLPVEGAIVELFVDHPQQAARAVASLTDPWRTSVLGDRLRVIRDRRTTVDLAGELRARGFAVSAVREEAATIEDAFVALSSPASDSERGAS
ncbi:MAG TPA: ATP-binding cassette domain-containing protein [Thermoanaerobaculia bacterium]|jgi:ABC-2 type transport system ATP-binding protein